MKNFFTHAAREEGKRTQSRHHLGALFTAVALELHDREVPGSALAKPAPAL